MTQIRLLAASLTLLLAACGEQAAAPADSSVTPAASPPAEAAAVPAVSAPVVVYSSRQEHLIKPVFDRFTQETGIEVQFQTGEEGPLIARLEAEGPATFADLLYTVDAGNLWLAANKGLLAPLDSPVLEAGIPAHLQDPENRWFGLSVRARTIVYSTERVDPAQLSTYEALADPQWQAGVFSKHDRPFKSTIATYSIKLTIQLDHILLAHFRNNCLTYGSDSIF